MTKTALRIATSNAIQIEKGIPVPYGSGSNTHYPLEQMEVGDSFAVPAEKYGSLRQTASYRGPKLGMTFRVSKRGPEVRCWRTA